MAVEVVDEVPAGAPLLSSTHAPITERNAASQALDDLNKQKDTTEVTTPLEESQSKLAAVANNLNTAKEAELKQDLDSEAPKGHLLSFVKHLKVHSDWSQNTTREIDPSSYIHVPC